MISSLTPRLWKNTDAFVPSSVHTMNPWRQQITFLAALKQTIVTPIYKSGNRHEAE